MNRQAGRRILCIDGRTKTHVAFGVALLEAGFEYLSAGTAAQGLIELDTQSPDLVIVAEKLPDSKGIDLCRVIRSHYPGSALPVFYIAGNLSRIEMFITLTKELDVSLILHSPVNAEDLVAHVRRTVSMAPQTSVVEDDFERQMNELRNEYAESLQEQFERIESCIGTIEQTPDEQAAAEILSIVHKMHGSAGTFGFPKAGDIAAGWEKEMRSAGTTPMSAKKLRSRLEALKTAFAEQMDISKNAKNDSPDAPDGILFFSNNHALLKKIGKVDTGGKWQICSAEMSAKECSIEHGFVPRVVFIDAGYESTPQEIISGMNSHWAGFSPHIVLVSEKRDLIDMVDAVKAGAHRIMQKASNPKEYISMADELVKSSSRERGTILILDDDKNILRNAEHMLSSAGYLVATSTDPATFWNKIEEVQPDTVILDINLPGYNGIDICRAIRANSKWHGMPVLFLSASESEQDILSLYQAGADDYLRKPIIKEMFLARIANRIERVNISKFMSERDYLTQLLNRRTFTERFEAMTAFSQRRGIPLSIALVDIDNFKSINDTHGHATGDNVLEKLSNVLKSSVRTEDLVCRWGGEEFAVAMIATDTHGCVNAMARILEDFRNSVFKGADGREFSLTFSAGVAEYPRSGTSLNQLAAAADKALYQAKASGRNMISHDRTGFTSPETGIYISISDPGIRGDIAAALRTRGFSFETFESAAKAAGKAMSVAPQERSVLLLFDVSTDWMNALGDPASSSKTPPAIVFNPSLIEIKHDNTIVPPGIDFVGHAFSLPNIMNRIRLALP